MKWIRYFCMLKRDSAKCVFTLNLTRHLQLNYKICVVQDTFWPNSEFEYSGGYCDRAKYMQSQSMYHGYYLKFCGYALAFINVYLKLLFVWQYLLLVHMSRVNFAVAVSPAEQASFCWKFWINENKTNQWEITDIKYVQVTRSLAKTAESRTINDVANRIC